MIEVLAAVLTYVALAAAVWSAVLVVTNKPVELRKWHGLWLYGVVLLLELGMLVQLVVGIVKLSTDDRVVGGAREQLQAIAFGEVHGAVQQPEPDRARGDDDDLVVVMVVRRVAITRPVRPRTGLESFVHQLRPEGARIRHGRRIVPAVGRKRRRP